MCWVWHILVRATSIYVGLPMQPQMAFLIFFCVLPWLCVGREGVLGVWEWTSWFGFLSGVCWGVGVGVKGCGWCLQRAGWFFQFWFMSRLFGVFSGRKADRWTLCCRLTLVGALVCPLFCRGSLRRGGLFDASDLIHFFFLFSPNKSYLQRYLVLITPSFSMFKL